MKVTLYRSESGETWYICIDGKREFDIMDGGVPRLYDYKREGWQETERKDLAIDALLHLLLKK